jgi:hypothetical protein
LRATSSTLAPSATSSRLPDGVKTILCKCKFSTRRPVAAAGMAVGEGIAGSSHIGTFVGRDPFSRKHEKVARSVG